MEEEKDQLDEDDDVVEYAPEYVQDIILQNAALGSQQVSGEDGISSSLAILAIVCILAVIIQKLHKNLRGP